MQKIRPDGAFVGNSVARLDTHTSAYHAASHLSSPSVGRGSVQVLPPPTVREMPVSPAALQRRGGGKEGEEPEGGSTGRRRGAGVRGKELKDTGGKKATRDLFC